MSGETRDCPECGARAVFCCEQPQQVEYLETTFVAVVPVWECSNCGFGYLDAKGQEIEHEALCRHIGVLSPRDIRALRERLSLTQEQLAGLTGFGVASIKRWERGALIQNKSADILLRLVGDNYVLSRLQEFLKHERERGLP
jgi:putative zinc finger/helix-turn-helix YgiT family protein